MTGSTFCTWAIDDSDVLISEIPHTLLAAVSFTNPLRTVQAMAELRRDLNLPANFEFKWNGRLDDARSRQKVSEGFRSLFPNSRGLVTIAEGRDRQHAAGLLCRQIASFCDRETIPFLVFDEGIVSDSKKFRDFLLNAEESDLKSAQFVSARSDLNDLVQCADLFAGFEALSVKLALGLAKDKVIPDEEGEIELSLALTFAFRYSLWGRGSDIDFDWDSPGNPPLEYFNRYTRDFGLRIHSSVDESVKDQIYDRAGVFYMGCMH